MLDYNVSYREKDGSIQCIIRYKDHNGNWKSKSKQGFKNQKSSKDWQSKTLKALKKEVKEASKLNPEYIGITYKEFSKIFLEDSKRLNEYNTYENDKNGIKRFSELNDKELPKITFLDIKKIVDKQLDEELSVISIKTYLSILNVMLNSALNDYEVISSNPLAGKKMKLPKEDKKDIKILSTKDSRKLLKIIKLEKDYLISLIALKCGLRIGEIIGLTWDSIDDKNSNLIVNKQWKRLEDKVWGFGPVKNKRNRKVPLPQDLLQALQNYEKYCVKSYDSRIFPDNRSNGSSRRLNAKYKRLGFDISIHDLRHTYATRLLAKGTDIKTVAEFMGDTVEVIIKTYIHFDDDMYEAGRERVENLF